MKGRYQGKETAGVLSMEEVKISSKGQIVIPKYLRDSLGLKDGSIVLVAKLENKIIIMPKPADAKDALIKSGQDIAMKNIRREIKEE
jgi:AbrB family looped-hinge helix DNA binding protein